VPRHYCGLSRPNAVDSTSRAIIPSLNLFFEIYQHPVPRYAASRCQSRLRACRAQIEARVTPMAS
jgi:hypothetical protein